MPETHKFQELLQILKKQSNESLALFLQSKEQVRQIDAALNEF